MSGAHRLKLTAADGKKYLTDVLVSDGIIALGKHVPSKKGEPILSKDRDDEEEYQVRAGLV